MPKDNLTPQDVTARAQRVWKTIIVDEEKRSELLRNQLQDELRK